MGSTHTLLTPTVIAKEALMLLENNLVMGNLVHRKYVNEFKKVGGSVSIRKPVKFRVTKSRTRSTSTITEQSITLTVATQAHVSWAFNSKDLTLTIEEYSERYVKPAAAALANTMDADVCALYDDVANSVWESTGFITPESFIVLGKAAQKMDEEACPPEDRSIALNPAANWSLANALKSLYVQDVAGGALKGGVASGGPPKGYRGTIAGFDIYMDQNIKTHTTGQFHATGSTAALKVQTAAGSGLLGSDQKSYPMIDFKIVNTRALKTGDVFTIAGVYAVNPMSGDSTGQLRQFTVTADASCAVTETTSGGAVTVYFEPAMVDTGPYATVDTLPAASAAVTIVGTIAEPYPQNLAFHKNAFALVTVPLEMPHGVWGARETYNGLSIRIVKDYDIDTDDEVCRLDVLYGVKSLYPEMAARIWGAEG
jgi:hypothetical protein